jgi:transcriptional regulator with XRE-family HTH domain
MRKNINPYLKEMGKRVRKIRRSKNISMRKLVKICLLHKSSISELENGKRDCHILTLKMLADLFEVDVKDFL